MPWIVVCRVVDGGEAEALGELRGLAARQAEERPKPRPVDGWHPRETVEAGAAENVHEHRLDLIGRRVPEGDQRATRHLGHLEEGPTSGIASPVRQPCAELQLETTQVHRQTSLSRDPGDQLGLRRRLLAQAVVDMPDHQLHAERATEQL